MTPASTELEINLNTVNPRIRLIKVPSEDVLADVNTRTSITEAKEFIYSMPEFLEMQGNNNTRTSQRQTTKNES